MSVDIIIGDALESLRGLPDSGFHCCITSPPYWGLRDYGTAAWMGGDTACKHIEKEIRTRSSLAEWSAKNAAGGGHAVPENIQFRERCGTCGAIRVDKQLGMERTPEEYVAHMVDVFREVRRVLRDDGTLWLNLGDSYSAWRDVGNTKASTIPPGLRPKDLVGVPWRVAFALQADGWYLRQDIIWHKPNPMPESVTDRCTKAHEYVFLLSKSARYCYDATAIAEPFATHPSENYPARAKIVGRGSQGAAEARGNDRDKSGGFPPRLNGRNRRSVWTIATKPFAGSHFAVMPAELARICILAGSPPGGKVLDPFAGSGTTGMVADQEGRGATMIELNESYAKMIRERTREAGLFSVEEPNAES